jgi:hypothetical protein
MRDHRLAAVLGACILTLTCLGGEVRAEMTPFGPGDADGSGTVDTWDSFEVLQDYNRVGEGLLCDLNKDGTVNGADLNEVLSNMGNHYSDSFMLAGVSLSTAVPEPATLAMLASGLLALLAYGWWKRR